MEGVEKRKGLERGRGKWKTGGREKGIDGGRKEGWMEWGICK